MRARMAISYSKITVELREISLKDRPKKLYEASSKGTVPVLITENNQVIDESLHIMLWALKKNAKQIVLGCGNINSPLMLIGGTTNVQEDISGLPFEGEVGNLLKKMLSAININDENVYLSYAINFRPPNDRKPTSAEIKRYSNFLQEHISIINPKIIVLMGSTAMEALTGLNNKISNERGKWKDIIIKNTSLPLLITFSPSYLLRYPENKKYSWEDLKKIKYKIKILKIII